MKALLSRPYECSTGTNRVFDDTCFGRCYKPAASFADTVRLHFRDDAQQPTKAIDVAFDCMRMLNDGNAVAAELKLADCFGHYEDNDKGPSNLLETMEDDFVPKRAFVPYDKLVNEDGGLVGQMLIAHPWMVEPTFGRTLVLLAERTEEQTVGFITNKPMGCFLRDAYHQSPSLACFMNNQLYYGGPVGSDVHVLHPYGQIEGALEIIPGVYHGASDFEQAATLVQQGEIDPTAFHFFLGCSVWGKEQLDGELTEGSWFLLDSSASAEQNSRQFLEELVPSGELLDLDDENNMAKIAVDYRLSRKEYTAMEEVMEEVLSEHDEEMRMRMEDKEELGMELPDEYYTSRGRGGESGGAPVVGKEGREEEEVDADSPIYMEGEEEEEINPKGLPPAELLHELPVPPSGCQQWARALTNLPGEHKEFPRLAFAQCTAANARALGCVVCAVTRPARFS
jgi:putative transcriptional regulator